MVGQKATGAVDGCRNSRCDGLMDRQRAGTAMMRGAGLVGLTMLSLSLVALALAPYYVFLLKHTIALLLHFAFSLAVAIKTAGVERLGVHRGNLLVASSERRDVNTTSVAINHDEKLEMMRYEGVGVVIVAEGGWNMLPTSSGASATNPKLKTN